MTKDNTQTIESKSVVCIDNRIAQKVLSGIPFFNLEKSKQEAILMLERYKNAHPDMDEYKLKRLLSEKVIKNYAQKTANWGAWLCVPTLIPFIGTLVSSVGSIPIEQSVLTAYNLNLMIKLAVINDYPLSNDDFLDTLIKSAKSHGIAGVVTKFALRSADACPFVGQLFTLLIGIPLCMNINRSETFKFGKSLLREYDINYDIKDFPISIWGVLWLIIALIVIGFASLKAYTIIFNTTMPDIGLLFSKFVNK